MVVGTVDYGRTTAMHPAVKHYAITPSDTVDEDNVFRGLYVGVGGNVAIVTVDDTAVTYLSVPTGTLLPIQGRRVNDTNTTATDMVGLY